MAIGGDQGVGPAHGCGAPWTDSYYESPFKQSFRQGMDRAMDVGIEVGNVTTAAVGAFASGVLANARGQLGSQFGGGR